MGPNAECWAALVLGKLSQHHELFETAAVRKGKQEAWVLAAFYLESCGLCFRNFLKKVFSCFPARAGTQHSCGLVRAVSVALKHLMCLILEPGTAWGLLCFYKPHTVTSDCVCVPFSRFKISLVGSCNCRRVCALVFHEPYLLCSVW